MTTQTTIDLVRHGDDCIFANYYQGEKWIGAQRVSDEWARGRRMLLRQWRLQKGLCALCKYPFQPEDMTRDHIIPRSKGGSTQWDNIQLTCAACNHKKGDKSDSE